MIELIAWILLLIIIVSVIALYNRQYIEDFERIDPEIFQPDIHAMRDEELREILCNGDAPESIRKQAAEILETRKSYNL